MSASAKQGGHKNRDAQKKRSSNKVHGVSSEARTESMLGKICERGPAAINTLRSSLQAYLRAIDSCRQNCWMKGSRLNIFNEKDRKIERNHRAKI